MPPLRPGSAINLSEMPGNTFASAHMLMRERPPCLGFRRYRLSALGAAVAGWRRRGWLEIMTISNMSCDICGRFLDGPAAGVRFVYHPGVPELRDDSGLACVSCWDAVIRGLDVRTTGRCAACAAPAPWTQSLHVRRFDVPGSWRLCARHCVDFLNSLSTVRPKLDVATFRFPAAGPAAGPEEG